MSDEKKESSRMYLKKSPVIRLRENRDIEEAARNCRIDEKDRNGNITMDEFKECLKSSLPDMCDFCQRRKIIGIPEEVGDNFYFKGKKLTVSEIQNQVFSNNKVVWKDSPEGDDYKHYLISAKDEEGQKYIVRACKIEPEDPERAAKYLKEE